MAVLRSRVSALVSLIVWLGLLAGCAPAAAPAPAGGQAPAAPKEPVTVKLGLVGQGVDLSAPQYVSKERGIWEKYGVKVEITEYNSGPAAQEALAGGQADVIHFFPPGVATAIGKGVKQKMVAADASRPSAWHIMVPANSSIRTVQDLAGKELGITAKGATTDYYALWVATSTR
jgi:ABC-type nitrate/sulfonate/bicarbonate transport system substrate-binding protein